MDLPTLGISHNSKPSGRTTQEQKDLGNLHSLRQTIREDRTNRPKLQTEPPVTYRKKWTVRWFTTDSLTLANCL
jgi:hypothetical protein